MLLVSLVKMFNRSNVNTRKRKNCDRSNRRQHKRTISVCCFCQWGDDGVSGKFFKDVKSNIAAHQFCLYFSAGLPQKGRDEDGFDGFLLTDILKEIRRTKKLECKYCGLHGASSGCGVKSCRTVYHYRCGLYYNVQFRFYGTFDSFCKSHRKYQDMSFIKRCVNKVKCPICFDNINKPSTDIVKMPCCKDNFAHKECVQRQAMASGYFFKCPMCNNVDQFLLEMKTFGIFIPQKDAEWEENDAFAELLENYSKCDWPLCKCDLGPLHFADEGDWLLIHCYHCGQSAVHSKCIENYKIPVYDYVCSDCNDVVNLTRYNHYMSPKCVDNRTKEHRRRRSQFDASMILTPYNWKKRFGLKDFCVLLTPMPKDILTKYNTVLEDQATSCIVSRREPNIRKYRVLFPSIAAMNIQNCKLSPGKRRLSFSRYPDCSTKFNEPIFPSAEWTKCCKDNEVAKDYSTDDSTRDDELIVKFPFHMLRKSKQHSTSI